MKKNLLLVAALFAGIASYAQCEEVASLNEDFSDFTITNTSAQAFPQQCWSSIGAGTSGPWIYTAEAGTPANQYAVYYTHMAGANVAGYIISPELSTVDGAHQLSFDTFKPAGQGGQTPTGVVTVEVGLVSSPTDATDFEVIGTAYTIAAELTTHANIVIPASETKKYIAFKFLSANAFNAAALDNVVYNEIPNPCPAVATLDENFNSFTFTTPGTGLPQNCWSNINTGPLVYISGTAGENYATFYASQSPNIDAYLVSPELTTLGGNYELSFDTKRVVMGPPPAAGTVTIQLGTLSDKADAATFVAFGDPIAVTDELVNHANIAITAEEGQKYIAFRIVGNTVHNAALIDNVVWSEIPVVCEAVATIDEGFSDVEELEDICWSVATTGQMVDLDATEEGNAYISFYSFFAPTTFAHVVTPEISTLGEAYTFSFDAGMATGSAPGTVTIQLGTVSNPADAAATFTAFGDAITVPATSATFTNSSVPSDAGDHIAFRISASGSHVAAMIDNVKWQATAGIDDLNKNTFSIFPNPTADKNITINHNLEGNGTVNVYSLTGAKVFAAELNAASQNINLAGLSAGMYIVKVEAGNYSASKKLIIQ